MQRIAKRITEVSGRLAQRRTVIARSVSWITVLASAGALLAALAAPATRAAAAGVASATAASSTADPKDFPVPTITWDPEQYICYRAEVAPKIDGQLDDRCWQPVPWTTDFVDIEGLTAAKPRFVSKVKMVWDDQFLYLAALLEDRELWGTLSRRDTTILDDNAFSIFIDPDGDNHDLCELDLNVMGTLRDRLLDRPERDGGTAHDDWNLPEFPLAILPGGTVNNPADSDAAWIVELALPWTGMQDFAHRPAPPRDGDIWRLNLARVEWHVRNLGSKYVKVQDPDSGQPLPPDTWVWSAQGIASMQYPEMWGFVQFSDRAKPLATSQARFKEADWKDRWRLMQYYYHQKQYQRQHGRYAADPGQLSLENLGLGSSFACEATADRFEAGLQGDDGTVHVNQEGRLWTTTD
jgi:hypothetical protein